jgi:hypothetical protein
MTDRKARATVRKKQISRWNDRKKCKATAAATANAGVLRFAQDDRYIVNNYK